MADDPDEDGNKDNKDPLRPLNIKKKARNPVAAAIAESTEDGGLPTVTAAGRGKIAEQILQLAFENDIKVRQDSALADMLVTIEVDSPIPSEAFMAVAEILAYVYRANGEPNPFDAALDDLKPPKTEDKPKETPKDDPHGTN